MREEFVTQPAFDDSLPFSIELAGISYCDESYYISRKNSNVVCIEYILSGCGTVKVNGKTFHPAAGDTYMLIPGSNHEYFSDEDDPWVKIWFNAQGKLIDELIEAYNLAGSTVFHCNTKPFIEKIHKALENKTHTPAEIADETALHFHALLQFLAKHKENESSVSDDAVILKNYIDSHLYSQITIENLANLIYKSPSQTIRIFKKAYGKSPYDYYMDNRIKKAIAMLSGTSFSVKEISYQLGFCDEHYFSTLFHKKTGKAPGDFRK